MCINSDYKLLNQTNQFYVAVAIQKQILRLSTQEQQQNK